MQNVNVGSTGVIFEDVFCTCKPGGKFGARTIVPIKFSGTVNVARGSKVNNTPVLVKATLPDSLVVNPNRYVVEDKLIPAKLFYTPEMKYKEENGICTLCNDNIIFRGLYHLTTSRNLGDKSVPLIMYPVFTSKLGVFSMRDMETYIIERIHSESPINYRDNVCLEASELEANIYDLITVAVSDSSTEEQLTSAYAEFKENFPMYAMQRLRKYFTYNIE